MGWRGRLYTDCRCQDLRKGLLLRAVFFFILCLSFSKATRDIDLLAKNMPNNAEDMKKVFENILTVEYDDALKYDLNSLDVKDINEFKEYHGVNVSVIAYLDRDKVPVSIDNLETMDYLFFSYIMKIWMV